MLRQVYFFCLSNEFKIYFFNFTALISIDHRSRFSNTDRSNTTIKPKYLCQSTNFQQFLTGSVIFHGKSQIFFPQGSILQSCKHRKNCLGNQQVMYQHQNNSHDGCVTISINLTLLMCPSFLKGFTLSDPGFLTVEEEVANGKGL